MVMNPSTDIYKIDAYPDADFAGMYGHEKPMDPSCVKSCSGFVITFADVRFFGNQNCRLKQLCLLWRPKSLH